MLEIDTQRLAIIALPENQLRLSLYHPEQVSESLGCKMTEGAFSDASRRAIYVKLEKMEQVSEKLHPWFTYWLIVLKETKMGIGLVGFKGLPDGDGEVEIGYGISSEYQGNGYMTEAVRGLVIWAFQQPGCSSVRAETLRTNIASQRVLQKSGFFVTHDTQMEIYWRILKMTIERKVENKDMFQAGN